MGDKEAVKMDGLTRRQVIGLAGVGAASLVGLPTRLGRLVLESAGAGPVSSGPAPIAAQLESRALASTFHFRIDLPPGYDRGARHYPVVYFLHGLPASPTSYLHLGWAAQSLAEAGRDAIVVVPQGTRVAGGDSEYHNWGAGDDWETAIARELPAWIERNLRAGPDRSARAVVGYSAGGYGASIIGLRNPDLYSSIQSWSGYFHPTDPTGRKLRSVGSQSADEDADVGYLVPRLQAQFRRYPTRFAFYVGASDPTFVPANLALARALDSAGVPHTFRVYPGGHSAELWQEHASAWLALAVDSLGGAPARLERGASRRKAP